MQQPTVIDTHAHLDMEEFDLDCQEVIERALGSGVSNIITVGIDLASSRKAVDLAVKYPQIRAAAGIHPHDAATVRKEDIDKLADLARHPEVVAYGEMGLDYYRNRAPREAQLQVFRWQLELAATRQMPVIIHCRQAEKDTLPVLRDWIAQNPYPAGKPRGVIHCFSGDEAVTGQYLEMGFFLAFGAYIGYPSSQRFYSSIKKIPADRLLLETDCPFLPPQKLRGKRNEPSYVLITAEVLAQIRQTTLETIARETRQNARLLFGITD